MIDRSLKSSLEASPGSAGKSALGLSYIFTTCDTYSTTPPNWGFGISFPAESRLHGLVEILSDDEGMFDSALPDTGDWVCYFKGNSMNSTPIRSSCPGPKQNAQYLRWAHDIGIQRIDHVTAATPDPVPATPSVRGGVPDRAFCRRIHRRRRISNELPESPRKRSGTRGTSRTRFHVGYRP